MSVAQVVFHNFVVIDGLYIQSAVAKDYGLEETPIGIQVTSPRSGRRVVVTFNNIPYFERTKEPTVAEALAAACYSKVPDFETLTLKGRPEPFGTVLDEPPGQQALESFHKLQAEAKLDVASRKEIEALEEFAKNEAEKVRRNARKVAKETGE